MPKVGGWAGGLPCCSGLLDCETWTLLCTGRHAQGGRPLGEQAVLMLGQLDPNSWTLNPKPYFAQVAMPKVGGRWASGLPYLDGAVKRADARAAGLWLELRQLHVEALKACALPGSACLCRGLQGAMQKSTHARDVACSSWGACRYWLLYIEQHLKS